jgi:hypothetical protein
MKYQLRYIALVLALFPSLIFAQSTRDDVGTNPYLSWNGPGYPWPQSSDGAPALTSNYVFENIEGTTYPRLVHFINGGDLKLSLGNLQPFYLGDKHNILRDWKNSLVLADSGYPGAQICFTLFDKGVFFPELNIDAIMGYAKALASTNNGNSRMTVQIVEPPSELARKEALAVAKPLYITWKIFDPASKTDIQCTDYFFEIESGSILVVSVIADSDGQPGVRLAAKNLLRTASFISKDN